MLRVGEDGDRPSRRRPRSETLDADAPLAFSGRRAVATRRPWRLSPHAAARRGRDRPDAAAEIGVPSRGAVLGGRPERPEAAPVSAATPPRLDARGPRNAPSRSATERPDVRLDAERDAD